MPTRERDLYEPIRDALQNYLCQYLGNCLIENTSSALTTAILPFMDDWVLFYVEKDLQRPDLTGGFETSKGEKKVITVEIKKEVEKIDDIYQAKRYAEVFNAEYAFFFSYAELPPRVKRFLVERKAILNYSFHKQLIVARFNELNEFEIDQDLYEGMLPEPFKSVYQLFVYSFDAAATQENLLGRCVIVRGRKVYDVEGWVKDFVRTRRVSFGVVQGRDFETWLNESGFEYILGIPTKKQLGL